MAELTVAYLLKTPIRQLVFAPDHRNLGVAMQGLIVLDPRHRSPLARTLLHELIHIRRPMWSETRVRREESQLWRGATWREKAALYKLLGRGKTWEGEEEFDGDDSRGDPGGTVPGSEKGSLAQGLATRESARPDRNVPDAGGAGQDGA